MSNNNVIELSGRESAVDPLTELLRKGAQELIARAVEAELAEHISQYEDERAPDGMAGMVRNGYPPGRAANGRGAGNGPDSQGTVQDGQAGDIPFSAGASVCEEDEIAGSGATVGVSDG